VEAHRLKGAGQGAALGKCRWCFLECQESQAATQSLRLAELLKMSLRTARVHLLEEDSHRFWDRYPA
jgi:hypothetical protein